jgi:hypothetical protein
LIPTRTPTWSGTLIAYKVYVSVSFASRSSTGRTQLNIVNFSFVVQPLLSDVEGCVTIRLGMKETQDMVDLARKDPVSLTEPLSRLLKFTLTASETTTSPHSGPHRHGNAVSDVHA